MNNDQFSGKRFFGVTVLNVTITIAEFLGGIFSGSLSLISDAFHNLGDSASVVLSYVAHRISGRPQNQSKTFGYKRAQILAAFVNAMLLMLISAYLIYEAIDKIFHPEEVKGSLMLTVALIGLVANLISTFALNKGAKHNLNIRSTYLHLLSDTLSSVGVLIGGILIQLFNWYIIDPLVTIAVAVYIIIETWFIIKKTISILMESSPKLDYQGIQNDLLKIDGVNQVHHVHAWQVDENSIMFSAHINMDDMKISEAEKIYHPIYEILHNKYGIMHVTIQAEVNRGKGEDLFYDRGTDIK